MASFSATLLTAVVLAIAHSPDLSHLPYTSDLPDASSAPDSGAQHAYHGPALSEHDKRAIAMQPVAQIGGSEFLASCKASHIGGNDPIVRFGQTGMSHIHQFIGNTSTDASSTQASLRAGGTTCNPASDKTPYWVPALYKNGALVPPDMVTIYYQGIGAGPAVPFPQGLKMVVGNPLAATPDDNPSARWNCEPGGASSRDFMNCPAGTKLQTYLNFPTCWNGRDLDSADHISHMAWVLNGDICPATHPVVVPRVQFLITYPTNGTGLTLGGTRNGVNVTTAPGWTFHGDFWNVWDQAELQRRVQNCINSGIKCGATGCPAGLPTCTDAPPTEGPSAPASPPAPADNRNAYAVIQAESFDSQSGLTTQATTDTGGGRNLTTINNGNRALYRGVRFGTSTSRQFSARVASGAPGGVGGSIEIRLDSPTAAPVGSFSVAGTGGWQNWRTIPGGLTGVTGTHDVYLSFSSAQPADYVNVNWFTFAP
jgi:hypothetical protein